MKKLSLKRLALALVLLITSIFQSIAFAEAPSDKAAKLQAESPKNQVAWDKIPEKEKRSPFLGTWKLVSYEMVPIEADGTEGQPFYPMTKDAFGYLMYNEQGYMSVNIMNPAPITGTPEEMIAKALTSYISYCGRYEVEQDKVLHYFDLCFMREMMGIVQERFYKFDDGKLVLSAAPTVTAGKQYFARLTWERADDWKGR